MCYVFICIRGGPLEIGGGGGGVAISEKKIMQGQFTWKKKSCRTPWWEKHTLQVKCTSTSKAYY